MEVHINNHPIEFDLDNEKTVTDILNSISEWTTNRALIFNEVIIDETLYTINQVPEITIDKVSQINCVVQSRSDIVFSTVDEGARYCTRILEFIHDVLKTEKLQPGDIANLKDGITWLNEVLSKVVILLDLDISIVKFKDKALSEYIGEMESLKEQLDEKIELKEAVKLLEEKAKNFILLNDIFKMLLVSDDMKVLILRSIESPDVLITMLNNTKNELQSQLDNIEQSAIAFQTGKDSEGAERLNNFIDYIFQYSRVCSQVAPVFEIDLSSIEVDGVTLEDKNISIKELLDETIQIMENNDIISLSDILEYEIKPFMENLNVYLVKLLQNTSMK